MTQSIARLHASDETGNASVATVQNTRSALATTIIVDTVQGWPNDFFATMGTPHTFVDPVTSEEITVISEATAVDFSGHLSGSNIEIDDIAPGYTDGGSAVGDIVIIRPTTQYADNIADVLVEAHNDDGTLNSAAIHSATPAGVVSQFAGSSAPTGWLMCDGSAVSRSTYADLFSAIGTTWGSGDGSTTFNLPDGRSRLPVGVGTGTWKFTFASTDVNTGTEQITVTASPEIKTGRKIQLTTTGTLPTGLSLATDYYIIVVDSTHISLATSLANAYAGTAINLTGAGSGTNTGTGTLSTYTLGAHGGRESHAHALSDSGQALIRMSTSSPFFRMRRVTTASWTGTLSSTVNPTVGSDSTTDTSGAALLGNTDEASQALPPYLALNYIIKT